MLTQESISRKDFLISIGLGGAALMAVLASCKNADNVAPSGVSVDISTAIRNVGDYTYSGDVIIARVSAGNTAASFVALSKACTHAGTTVTYQGNGVFYCPNHGAQFSSTGSVTRGPANNSLSKYNVIITGSTLTIS